MFHVKFLPANQAWAVLFGKDLSLASVLMIGTKKECEDHLEYITRKGPNDGSQDPTTDPSITLRPQEEHANRAS